MDKWKRNILVASVVSVCFLGACTRNDEPTIMREITEKTEKIAVVEDGDKTLETEAASATKAPEETRKTSETTKELDKVDVPQGDWADDDFEKVEDLDTLDSTLQGWSWRRNTEHKSVEAYTKTDLKRFGAYYNVDTEEKVVYLTFDEGYENGYTGEILDVLLENNVQASFFVVESYIKNNLDLVKRMKEEGHIVGNHSSTHPSFPEISDEQVIEEITKTNDTFLELTGYEMDRFLRPPRGEFSDRTLYVTRTTGYRSIFWSMAYKDWLVDEQPGKEAAYDHVMENYHPGCIILLHAVSESNTQALDDIIKSLKAEGYRFGNLYEVE